MCGGFVKYYDSNGEELNVGDRFIYTNKKWTSKASISESDGVIGVWIHERDYRSKLIPLKKFMKHHLIKCDMKLERIIDIKYLLNKKKESLIDSNKKIEELKESIKMYSDFKSKSELKIIELELKLKEANDAR